jgi:threonyl-tRNA synthetase
VVIHRAVLGSLERFFGLLIEHTAGALPFWIAPVQARFVPIGDTHVPFCNAAAEKLRALGLRVDVDASNASMGAKTREAQTKKIPYMLAVGDRELQAKSFSARKYGEKTSATLGEAELVALFTKLNDPISGGSSL